MGAAALQDGCAQAIGGGLQGGHILDSQEGIVRFAEANADALELLGDEGVAVEVERHVEREIAAHPHAHRAHDRVQRVEVVMQELLTTRLDQAVVSIAAGRSETRGVGDEGPPLFHAGQHTGDAFGSLQAAVEG